MIDGRSSNRCCRRRRRRPRVGASPSTIGACWKASCGFCTAGRAGRISPRSILRRAPAGVGSAIGKSEVFGSRYGGPFWPIWTKPAGSTGRSRSWTRASSRQKKGRVRRKDETWQGNKVHGGGGRPGNSCWPPSGIGLAGGSDAAGADARRRDRDPPRSQTQSVSAPTPDRRSSLRFRPAPGTIGATWHRTDLSPSPKPQATPDPGWTSAPPLSTPLEDRTHLRLVRKLPATRRTMGTFPDRLQSVLSPGLHPHRHQAVLKWVLDRPRLSPPELAVVVIEDPKEVWEVWHAQCSQVENRLEPSAFLVAMSGESKAVGCRPIEFAMEEALVVTQWTLVLNLDDTSTT